MAFGESTLSKKKNKINKFISHKSFSPKTEDMLTTMSAMDAPARQQPMKRLQQWNELLWRSCWRCRHIAWLPLFNFFGCFERKTCGSIMRQLTRYSLFVIFPSKTTPTMRLFSVPETGKTHERAEVYQKSSRPYQKPRIESVSTIEKNAGTGVLYLRGITLKGSK